MNPILSRVEGRYDAVLVLEDGSVFWGRSYFKGETEGEVVFNTGMVGYVESLTDPSYYGQILVQTYPLIGNYGVPLPKISDGILENYESERIQVRGYVVSELCETPSHHTAERGLIDWLEEEEIPHIFGIDTRMLTKHLRVHGTMLGILKSGELDLEELKERAKSIIDPNEENLVKYVSTRRKVIYNPGGSPTIGVIDCGVKHGILRELLSRDVRVIRYPYDVSASTLLDECDGILISNGPGNPVRCSETIYTISKLLEEDVPIFGICLGCQILALAAGGRTYKLKFGHRGQNQACIELSTKRCYVTSQNHGYAIDPKSLKGTGFEVAWLNVNDRSVEGIRHKSKPFFAVQFHPEASPGPLETRWLFDRFLEEVKQHA